MGKKRQFFYSLLLLLAACAAAKKTRDTHKPVFYIIGDSTVRNGHGTGSNGQWGWGSLLAAYFDTSRISVRNEAMGGRSSRTFITEGRWRNITDQLQPGDFVIMQFGHNDGGALDDTARARGTIKGIGDERQDIYNPILKKPETVYTYGYYMRQYISETRQHGATPIVCSPIPRNEWQAGKVVRSGDSYAGWAQQVAQAAGVAFIDLNELVAAKYEQLGADTVKTFFPADHTHTNLQGAQINAAIVAGGLKRLKPAGIRRYLK